MCSNAVSPSPTPPLQRRFPRSTLCLSRNVKAAALSFPFSRHQVKVSHYRNSRHRITLFCAAEFHDDWFEMAPLDDSPSVDRREGQFSTAVVAWQMLSSSDGEENDEEFGENSIAATDSTHTADDADALVKSRRRKNRMMLGIWVKLGLLMFLTILLLFVDCCAWKVVRLPLDTFYLSKPFFFSAALVWLSCFFSIPLLKKWKIVQIDKQQKGIPDHKRTAIPTCAGFFIVLIGCGVARFIGGSSLEVSMAALITLSFAAVGALGDALIVTRAQTSRIYMLTKLAFEVAIGSVFSLWMDGGNISSPYHMRSVVPLPPPIGLVCLGKCYNLLSTFSFVIMANSITSTDALNGLNGGTSALAFIGMSIAALPICCDISIYGASMAGACLGFVLHNRYKACALVGETGSVALGGGLAVMAACTGMFLPLFISSAACLLQALAMMEVGFSKKRKRLFAGGRSAARVANFGDVLAVYGIKEPVVLATKYCVSSVLAIAAGYVGLASA